MIDHNAHNHRIIEELRASRGKPDNPFVNRRLLLLTTTGAKSGQPRTKPMLYIPDGDRLLVIASNAGAPTHPDWYRNLLVYPQVIVELGNETFAATATVAEGAERQRLWEKIVALYPFFTEHQAQVSREIPVVVLERREG
jgi:deazaflavin-dependent oxidoreductase (nitroreductase family)